MLDQFTITNPFPGLRAFEEEEDILFFGREKQIDELVKKLRTTRLIAVIGSSGSGKSSLIKSGLIPNLQSGFMSGAGSNWRICSFRPGSDPIKNLVTGLVKPGALEDEEIAVDLLASLYESSLRRSSNGLIEVYKQSGIEKHNNLLILVDQFEEIFRFSKFESDSREGKRDSVAFINLLLKAAKQTEYPIYIVITMRSDFLSDCTEFRGLPEAINEGNYLVPRMTREERKDAIVGPISVANAKVSPRLLNLLLNDVGDNPDQLPILQHALMRTFDFWKNKDIPDEEVDLIDYEGIGTMEFALSQHADEAYAELATDNQRRICEVIFKALTDKESDARGIRRPCKLADLCKITNASMEEVADVINIFRKQGRGFLMPPIHVPLQPDTIIDISHESIMRVWNKLILWVEEEGESAKVYLRLSEAALMHSQGKGGILRDPELQVALKWREVYQPNEVWASRYNDYYEKSILYLEYSKQQYDLDLKNKEEKQRLRLLRIQRTAIVTSFLLIGAIFLSIYALSKKTEADKQTDLAQRKTKEAKASQQIAILQTKKAVKNKEEALKEKLFAQQSEKKAIEQKKLADAAKLIAEKNRVEALRQKDEADAQRVEAVKSKNLAENQRIIAQKQTALANENELKAIKEKKVSDRLRDLALSRILANESLIFLNENRIEESKERILKSYYLNQSNKGPSQNIDIFNVLQAFWDKKIAGKNILTKHASPVRTMVSLPNSNLIYSADENGGIHASEMNENGWQSAHYTKVSEPLRTMKISPDRSKLIALSAQGNGYCFQIMENKSLKLLNKFTFPGIPKSLSFVDDKLFLILSNTGINAYKLANTIEKGSFSSPIQFANLEILKNGHVYATLGKSIVMFPDYTQISSNPQTKILLPSQKNIQAAVSLSVDEDEKFVATGTLDGQIFIKELANNGKSAYQILHKSTVNGLKFTTLKSGTLILATSSFDQTVKIIDVFSFINKNKPVNDGSDQEDILTIKNHSKWIYGIEFIKNQWIVTNGEDNKLIALKPAMVDLYTSILKK
jgi:WD40 repeat protein/energy-coupling factor transporter ATP-binding protein EcfA2